MMFGYLLRAAGVDVIVLEKHADFFRDFRGDTCILHARSDVRTRPARGFLQACRTRGELRRAAASAISISMPPTSSVSPRAAIRRADAAVGPPEFPGRARESDSRFQLRMEHEAVGLISDGSRIIGVDGAELTARTGARLARTWWSVATAATPRAQSRRLEIDRVGVPIDVLWLRASAASRTIPNMCSATSITAAMLILINRGDYFQARPDHPQRLLRRHPGSAVSTPFAPPLPPHRAVLGDRVDEIERLGSGQSSSPSRSIACAGGIFPACSASATRPTPCRRRRRGHQPRHSRCRCDSKSAGRALA